MDGVGTVDAKGDVLQVVGKASGLGGGEGGRVRNFSLFSGRAQSFSAVSKKTYFAVQRCSPTCAAEGFCLPSAISVSLRNRPMYRSSLPCSGRTSGSAKLETEFDEPTLGRDSRGIVHRTRVAKPPPRGSETDKYETRKVYLGSKTAFRPPTIRRQKEHVAS